MYPFFISNLTLPIEDPILKFLLVLIIILGAPLLLNKIKVPHLLGLIIAGALVGPNGFNLLSRDSSIVVTGTTGLLYIMFLAGLEIDLGEFKKNKWKSLIFGVITFMIPFVLGYYGSKYLLHFNTLTSVLFASLFSSQTLITYPIVSKMGIAKSRSVNITVGGTMITDVASLLTLAVVVGMVQGTVSTGFWVKLSVSSVVFVAVVLFLFPIIGRWFFKRVNDKISQYIFVLVMIYLGAILAELAGIEGIIGAFFAGLALNKLIPHSSSLMNRIDFVGNAIFIPFFLISVGMLIDFSVFIKSTETLLVASVMIVSSIGGKYLAAMFSKKIFGFSKYEGRLLFGLSTASAAATLASVLVGYNVILSENELGEPVRLLNEHVLNGSILLILVSCTVASFVTMSSGEKILASEIDDSLSGNSYEEENILLAMKYEEIVEGMAELGLLIKSKDNNKNIFALNVINEEKKESSTKEAEKIFKIATDITASADVQMQTILRYDQDALNGIGFTVKQENITDLIIGVPQEKGIAPSFMYNLYNGYLGNGDINVFVYHYVQPAATVKNYCVYIPKGIDKEPGFFLSLKKIWSLAKNTGAQMDFHVPQDLLPLLKAIHKKNNIEARFSAVVNNGEAEKLIKAASPNEAFIIMMAKRGMKSYSPRMRYVPDLLNTYAAKNNYLLIYPSTVYDDTDNSELLRNTGDMAQIRKVIKRIFK